MYLAAHLPDNEKRRLPKPLVIPRPWDTEPEKRTATVEDLRAMFGPKG